jgi:hypothetical protein
MPNRLLTLPPEIYNAIYKFVFTEVLEQLLYEVEPYDDPERDCSPSALFWKSPKQLFHKKKGDPHQCKTYSWCWHSASTV